VCRWRPTSRLSNKTASSSNIEQKKKTKNKKQKTKKQKTKKQKTKNKTNKPDGERPVVVGATPLAELAHEQAFVEKRGQSENKQLLRFFVSSRFSQLSSI
jgi:hypothetical protein